MRALVLLTLLIARAAHADGYTVADLDVLDKQEAWDELERHLEDIAPSKRDAHWQAILERTALGALAQHAAEPVVAWGAADRFTRRFPTVKRSKDFMARRTSVGLAGLAGCLATNDVTCGPRFLDYVDADPANQALAVKAGLLIGATTTPVLAVAFFKRGLAGHKNAKECAETAVGRAVRAALELPADHPRVPEAVELASSTCWDALGEGLVSQLVNSGVAFRHNACGFLLAKKVLSPVSENLCKKEKP